MNERIKQLRKSLGLSQTEFGEKLGITASGISLIESGKINPADTTIRLIVSQYHVNAVWLRTGEGPMMEALDTDALVDRAMPNDSEWARSIMKAFARLPDSEWYRFRDMIEKIKKGVFT